MTFDAGKYFAALNDAGAAGAPPSVEEQKARAREEMIRQKAIQDDVANWSLLNSNLQHQQLARKAAGLNPNDVIPFGSTNTTVTYPTPIVIPQQAAPPVAPQSSGLKTAAAVGLSALLGAGGVGAASYLMNDKPPPAKVDQEYEWVLEVERGISGSIGGSGVSGGNPGPSKAGDGPQPGGD